LWTGNGRCYNAPAMSKEKQEDRQPTRPLPARDTASLMPGRSGKSSRPRARSRPGSQRGDGAALLERREASAGSSRRAACRLRRARSRRNGAAVSRRYGPWRSAAATSSKGSVSRGVSRPENSADAVATIWVRPFVEIIALDDPLKREFYAESESGAGGSVRTRKLRARIGGGMLFDRTAIAKNPGGAGAAGNCPRWHARTA